MGAGPPASLTLLRFSCSSNLRLGLGFARGFLGSFWPVPPRPSASRKASLALILLLRWSSYSDSSGSGPASRSRVRDGLGGGGVVAPG